jgi:putative redox protein
MSTHKILSYWKENMQFEAKDTLGHSVIMDIGEESGGDNAGFRPMPMLLVGLSGCMGVDVKGILNKMKVDLEKLELEVIGELDDNASPRVYKKITINFYFYGQNLKKQKLDRAIKLSEENYCNVSAILSQSALLEYNAFVVEE